MPLLLPLPPTGLFMFFVHPDPVTQHFTAERTSFSFMFATRISSSILLKYTPTMKAGKHIILRTGRGGSCLPQGILEAEIRTDWGSQCPLQGHTLKT